MFGYLFNRNLYEQKIFLVRYPLTLHQRHRFFNHRIILSIFIVLSFVLILRLWHNRINFGQYSYVFSRETILEQRQSRYHNITIAQAGSLRMLRFDMSGIEGVIHLENLHLILFDYMRLQLLGLLWNSEPERVLVIGLGAGILPNMLHYLSPKTMIDVVEIDAIVGELARKYFFFQENEYIRVYIEDGRHFLERQRSNQYDVILIDAFTMNGRIPHALRTLECLGEYRRILKSTGLVLANFLYEEESRYRQTYARALFKHLYRGLAKYNYILIGLNKDAKILDEISLQVRAKTFQQSRPLPDMNWMEEITHLHHENDNQWNRSVNIFTDQFHEENFRQSEKNE